MKKDFIFTSESVSEGHPDKICDQISDAVLDAVIERDRSARVACETLVKDNRVVLAGEVKTSAPLPDYEAIVREVVRDIGYTDEALGFSADSCEVIVLIGTQSPDIAQGVDRKERSEQGAGDQGLMFGYACDDTDQYMPAPAYYAHRLMELHAGLRKSGAVDWLGPDAKSQLSLRYENHRPCAVDTVVVSTQHAEDVSQDEIHRTVKEKIIREVLPEAWLSEETRYCINPTGKFVIGGPQGDCGLTGRKVIVDTYGGMARHGGGAFSGKDPSKVDRSAAYAARYMAKNVVAAGLASQCEIQLAYAIGVAEPVSVMVDSFGTGNVPDDRISSLLERHFDLTPYGIIEMLSLLKPIYRATACYGHFGREGFSWERCDKAEILKNSAV